MTHVGYQLIQQTVAFAIVGVAFWVIGRRLWGQILAFRSRPARRVRRAAARNRPAPSASPLIQVQLKPPAHLKRPPPEQ